MIRGDGAKRNRNDTEVDIASDGGSRVVVLHVFKHVDKSTSCIAVRAARAVPRFRIC